MFLSKFSWTKAVDWVPANSGLTNRLEPGCQYHLDFALDCVKKGSKKGKNLISIKLKHFS